MILEDHIKEDVEFNQVIKNIQNYNKDTSFEEKSIQEQKDNLSNQINDTRGKEQITKDEILDMIQKTNIISTNELEQISDNNLEVEKKVFDLTDLMKKKNKISIIDQLQGTANDALKNDDFDQNQKLKMLNDKVNDQFQIDDSAINDLKKNMQNLEIKEVENLR